jgi:hypothetical protein
MTRRLALGLAVLCLPVLTIAVDAQQPIRRWRELDSNHHWPQFVSLGCPADRLRVPRGPKHLSDGAVPRRGRRAARRQRNGAGGRRQLEGSVRHRLSAGARRIRTIGPPLRFFFRKREGSLATPTAYCGSMCANLPHGSGSLLARPASRTSSSLPASMSSSEPKAFV